MWSITVVSHVTFGHINPMLIGPSSNWMLSRKSFLLLFCDLWLVSAIQMTIVSCSSNTSLLTMLGVPSRVFFFIRVWTFSLLLWYKMNTWLHGLKREWVSWYQCFLTRILTHSLVFSPYSDFHSYPVLPVPKLLERFTVSCMSGSLLELPKSITTQPSVL